MEQEQTRLREVEAEMNAILEEAESQDLILSPEDIAVMEKGNNETEEQFVEEASEDEAEIFLGENPSALTPKEITWKKEIMDRVKIWTEKGLTISKEEKQKLITTVPRKGQVNLEAPALNVEIAVDLTPKALTKDTYFREYQNLAGAGLSASTSCLNIILNDIEKPIDREVLLKNMSTSIKLQSELFFQLLQARRSFLIGRFEEKIQKVLKKVEPTEWLFGDNLKTLIENTMAVERVSKEFKTKARLPLREINRPLNWRSSPARREVGRSSYRTKQNTSKVTNSSNRQGPYPAKRYYVQSQPQQRRQ